MDESFYPLLELYKNTVRHDIHHLTCDNTAFGVLLVDFVPGVTSCLLEAERYFYALFIEVQHFYRQIISYMHNFRRMANTTPTHIGYVQKARYPAPYIYERTEIGDVPHYALDHIALIQAFHDNHFLSPSFFIDEFFPGQDYVLARNIYLYDHELHPLA